MGWKASIIVIDNKNEFNHLELLKDLGFKHAFKAGISFGKDDLVIPANKGQLIEDTKKIIADYEAIMKEILRLEGILANESQIRGIVGEEFDVILENFGDERKTDIVAMTDEIQIEDLIKNEEVIVNLEDVKESFAPLPDKIIDQIKSQINIIIY